MWEEECGDTGDQCLFSICLHWDGKKGGVKQV